MPLAIRFRLCARGRRMDGRTARPISSNDYARCGPVAEDGAEGVGDRGAMLSPHCCCGVYFTDCVMCGELNFSQSEALWVVVKPVQWIGLWNMDIFIQRYGITTREGDVGAGKYVLHFLTIQVCPYTAWKVCVLDFVNESPLAISSNQTVSVYPLSTINTILLLTTKIIQRGPKKVIFRF